MGLKVSGYASFGLPDNDSTRVKLMCGTFRTRVFGVKKINL